MPKHLQKGTPQCRLHPGSGSRNAECFRGEPASLRDRPPDTGRRRGAADDDLLQLPPAAHPAFAGNQCAVQQRRPPPGGAEPVGDNSADIQPPAQLPRG